MRRSLQRRRGRRPHAGVKKLVAASSASIYGMADRFPTREDHHPYNNRTWYGATKVMLEGSAAVVQRHVRPALRGLRYFNVYGPRMDMHGKYTEVLIRWMDRIDAGTAAAHLRGRRPDHGLRVHRRRRPRQRPGACIADVSDEVFNVASGTETSLNELCRGAARRSWGRPRARVRTASANVNPVPRRLADTSKAREAAGLRAPVSLDEGLARLVDWWRADTVGETGGKR